MKIADDIIKTMIEIIQNIHGDLTFTDAVAEQIEQQLRSQYGGQAVYIQKREGDARRASILREFNGCNREEVCARHEISKAQFYRMIKGG